jgi:hypothetical protein
MEDRIGFGAAGQKQYHKEQKTSRHVPPPSPVGVIFIKNVSLSTHWIDMAVQEGPHV